MRPSKQGEISGMESLVLWKSRIAVVCLSCSLGRGREPTCLRTGDLMHITDNCSCSRRMQVCRVSFRLCYELFASLPVGAQNLYYVRQLAGTPGSGRCQTRVTADMPESECLSDSPVLRNRWTTSKLWRHWPTLHLQIFPIENLLRSNYFVYLCALGIRRVKGRESITEGKQLSSKNVSSFFEWAMHLENSNKPTRCAWRISSSNGPAHCSLDHLHCSFMQVWDKEEWVPYPAPPPPCSQCLRELPRLMQELPVPSPGGGLCGCIAVYVTCPLLGVSGDNSGTVSPDL